MKITVLVDNNTYIDRYYLAEPAVAYYIEEEERRILFDVGYSDVFWQNAQKMSIDLSKLTHIVLSHGHNDHTGGLRPLSEKINCQNISLVAHPDCFAPKYDETNNYIGAPFSAENIAQSFLYHPSREPVWISPRLLFLGEIPQMNAWENRAAIGTIHKDGKTLSDYNYDDTALVYLCKDESIFIITGCSHSGIGNIIAYAQKLTKRSKISGIIGGFHLLKDDERTRQTIAYLHTLDIRMLYPAHCISLQAKAQMLNLMPVCEVGVGLELKIL